jgi:putative Holliday junction resolvase
MNRIRGRVVALDFGLKRIGVAVSDEMRIISQPKGAVLNDANFLASLKKILPPLSSVDLILIGLPLHMNGKESDMSLAARKFGEKLQVDLNIPIQFWDERLSSAQAERSMLDREFNRKKRSENSDSQAAALLLQCFLESMVIT